MFGFNLRELAGIALLFALIFGGLLLSAYDNKILQYVSFALAIVLIVLWFLRRQRQ
jgi:hypothetical protein